ncbi:MAG: AbrB/MazE/SpoVT family DNA-binding domain-containing protein [Candidatus Omnitrophica bacterium]|nr:AbrB/MazE/SpoVT family DNA-binding domain-containing protein [Candidatus Omnitrophota bacterium]
MSSSVVKVARNYQITLPREIREKCNLKEGDLLNFEIRDSEIVLNPVCVVKKEQAFFFKPDWQDMVKKSEEEIKKGRCKTYRNAKSLERETEK